MIIPVPVGGVQWFMPGSVHRGDYVSCGGARVRITTLSGGTDWSWAKGRPQISFSARNNAVVIACGASIPGYRPFTKPYVIGQNGLDFIRGPNTLAALERVYGPRSRWTSLGLSATFSHGVLVRANVEGRRWSALTGVHVGDSIARLVWENAGARRLSATTWKIAARLVAVVSAGKVAGFTAYTSR